MISMIVAVDKNCGIGKNNKLPWVLPADLSYFKITTMGNMVVMGRKTYESIGRLLPGRMNVIITSDKSFTVEGAIIVHSIEKAVEICRTQTNAFVIGGSSIYEEMLPYVDRLYVTEIEEEFECDSFFPKNYKDLFTQKEVVEVGTEKGLKYTFNVYNK